MAPHGAYEVQYDAALVPAGVATHVPDLGGFSGCNLSRLPAVAWPAAGSGAYLNRQGMIIMYIAAKQQVVETFQRLH